MREGMAQGAEAFWGQAWPGLVLASLVVVRASDLGMTLYLDPALAGERNPLHLHLGAGPLVLLAVNAAVVAAVGLLFLRSTDVPTALPRGLSPGGFLSHALYGGRHPWWHVAWRAPTSPNSRWLAGRFAVALTVGLSLLVVAGNAASALMPAGAQAWAALMGGSVRYLLTFTLGTLVCASLWCAAEYATYRSGSPAAS